MCIRLIPVCLKGIPDSPRPDLLSRPDSNASITQHKSKWDSSICTHSSFNMTPLNTLLQTFRNSSATEREKGTYFEELIRAYLCNEAIYRYLYVNQQEPRGT